MRLWFLALLRHIGAVARMASDEPARERARKGDSRRTRRYAAEFPEDESRGLAGAGHRSRRQCDAVVLGALWLSGVAGASLSGCASEDACKGRSETCLSLTLTGAGGVEQVDQLQLFLSRKALPQSPTMKLSSAQKLPFKVAVLWPDGPGTLSVHSFLEGTRNGVTAEIALDLRTGAHSQKILTLFPPLPGGGGDMMLPPMDLRPANDLRPPADLMKPPEDLMSGGDLSPTDGGADLTMVATDGGADLTMVATDGGADLTMVATDGGADLVMAIDGPPKD